MSVKENISRAAIVVLTFPKLEWIETAIAEQQTAFPYISGLLSFREGPVILEAHAQLHHRIPAIKCRAMSFKKLRALVYRIDSQGDQVHE